MQYFGHMLRVLKLDSAVYAELAKTNRTLWYAAVNITVMGLLYGVAAIYFSEALINPQAGAAVAFNPQIILMMGVSVAFLMHGGAALFIWVFCRGIGGAPLFMPLYLNLGAVAMALWPLVPALAALQAGIRTPMAYGYTLVAGLAAIMVSLAAIRQATGLSPVKLSLAVCASMLYAGCFLYLWL